MFCVLSENTTEIKFLLIMIFDASVKLKLLTCTCVIISHCTDDWIVAQVFLIKWLASVPCIRYTHTHSTNLRPSEWIGPSEGSLWMSRGRWSRRFGGERCTLGPVWRSEVASCSSHLSFCPPNKLRPAQNTSTEILPVLNFIWEPVLLFFFFTTVIWTSSMQVWMCRTAL